MILTTSVFREASLRVYLEVTRLLRYETECSCCCCRHGPVQSTQITNLRPAKQQRRDSK